MPVRQKIAEIVTKVLRKPDFDFQDSTTFDDLGADSLDMVQIMASIEDEYGIELADEGVPKVRNMGEFVSLVEQRIAQKT